MIQIRDLIKIFDGKEVLQQLNMSVEKGRIYGLLGANGAGNTTIFKLISGLMQPTAGTIRFHGNEIHTHNREFLKEMGIRQMRELFLTLAKDRGMTILISSHSAWPVSCNIHYWIVTDMGYGVES